MRPQVKSLSNAVIAASNERIARERQLVETLAIRGRDTTDAMALFANSIAQALCSRDDDQAD
jgi:hypothetical protein